MGSVAAVLRLELDVLVETALPIGFDPEGPRHLVEEVLRREGAAGAWSVAVVLTDDRRLRTLHREFMGIDTETDVMTFPRDDVGGLYGEERGGDIVVSVERAVEQATEFGVSGAEEVRFLVVHGLLHLLGWEDGTHEARGRMLTRQGELMAAIDAGGHA